MAQPSNFRLLKRTRRKPEKGDIFVFQHVRSPDQFFFGRVISTDALTAGTNEIKTISVYIYANGSKEKHDIPELKLDNLLIPPFGTNTLAWTRGYFETVMSLPLRVEDVPARQCFQRLAGEYFDECGKRMPGPVEPVGSFGIKGPAGIDDLVGRAIENLITSSRK